MLKLGSKGESVKSVQRSLKIKDDGKFGSITESAIKKWQNSNGFQENGILTNEQFNLLTGTSGIQNDHLNISKLRGHIPDVVIDELVYVIVKFGITTKLRLAHFLSQCSHESGGWMHKEENLNYSASGLKKIFPGYFPGNLNLTYANKPEMIASRVYASRMGNGNELSKEGWKFRGRGYIQLTGKNNYTSFGNFIGEDLISKPELVSIKYSLASAGFFFNSNKLWTICDRGADNTTIEAVTRRVNGGLIGINDRIKHFKKYYKLIS